ncbi:hypothetical protein [Acidaminococcus intestini]|uniref:Large polyvalent protein associated domain-containing protein n=1 Tax=Acidaminococcus intestini (strain RyC-MR95) TaxID=568816 RepID=G4Q3W9_ACIIR|nr:hypothetical protein [Acidaminococcus intestini]AEQ23035.1 hypothetical protein Acin_1824 [Acidaminococcus intestini RyC-MR95]
MAKTIYPDAETIRRAANRAKATAVDGRFTDDFINARTYDPYDPPESMKQVKNNTDTVTTMVDQSYLAPAMNDYNDDGGFAPAIGPLKEFAKNFTDGDTQTMTEQSYLWTQDPDAPTANESLNTIGKAIQPTLDAAIRSTTLYNNIQYNYDTEDKYIQARRMGTMFGKSPDYFLADREAYVRAAQMLAGYDMDDRVAPDIDRNDPVAFGKYLNEHYPILASADAATFAVALENAKDVKSVQGIGEALSIAKEMFFIQEESMDIARRHFKGEGGDYLTDTEQDRRVWLNHRLQELKDKIPNFFDSMGLNVLTNTAVQLGGMGLDMGVGAAAGAVAGAATFGVTKNMGAAKAVGSSVMKWGSAASMFYRQVGDKYLEYSAMQASNGKPLYTPDEARVAAAIETGIETGIEFWNYDEIMGALSGGGRRAIMDIVKENKGNRDAIMGGLKGVLKGQLKSWIPRMKEEVVEEGLQSAASDAFHNALLALRPSSKERAFTVGEIVGNAGGAMLEAAPSVMGMVAIGDAASNFGSVRKLAGIARLNSELDMEQVSNAFTFSTLNALKEDIKTNNLFKKDPELYKETVKEAVKDSGMEKVYVDTEMLLKEEGGEQLLNDLGKEAGYTADELQNIKDTNADLEVPTEVYCQVALPSNLADKAIDLTTSDPRHNSPARIKETTERIQRTIVELSERDDKQLAGVIDNIVDSHFKADDTEARALASEIVAANPTDVHKEIVRRRKELKAQWDAMIEPEIENIERANKNPSGGMLMPNDDPTILNDYEKQIRVPYRTEQWKKAFGKESLRKWQYVDLAYATLTNDTNMIPFDLPGSAVEWKLYADKLTDEEMANIEVMHAENKKKLDAISDGIELLNRVDDALQDVDMTETEATRGMDKDTYAVYRSTYEVLMQGNKEVQKSARQSAIIFARMCARLAHEMAEQGALEGTPLQVARMLTIDPNAKTAGEGHNQVAWHGSPFDFDSFDLGKIGAGEGNQAHGWGLYFAKNKKISEAYKSVFGYKGLSINIDDKHYTQNEEGDFVENNKEVEYGSPLSYALNQLIASEGDKKAAIKELRDNAKRRENSEIESAKTQSEAFLKAADLLEKAKNVNTLTGGKLYQVEVPENDVLLDEQKPFSEQPEKVKRGIEQAFKSVDDNLKENFVKRVLDYNDEGDVLGKNYVFYEYKAEHQNEDGTVNYADFFKELDKKDYDVDGQAIYDGFSSVGANFVNGFNDENASKLLNKYGIKGITYEGREDSRCFVVFDDKAVKIIDKYYQDVKTDILGATTVDGRLISLLPKADASTFIHESAHWYLITMEKLAKNKKATKQFKADYQRIRSWTKTKGFKIQKEGHEKFARGFEAYLRSGKAPTAALNGVFARFKQWLSKIYSDFKALGGKPSPTVARVFDRMIATDEEIEIQLKEEGINDFVRAGGYKSASANVKKRWKQWATATREEAKAKVMQKVMADIAEEDATDRNEIVKGFADATREDLAASPLWQAHDAIKAAGGDLSVLQYYNFTPDEYEAAVKEAGGSLDAALATEVEKFKKDLYADRMDPKAIEEMASEAIKKSKYQEMLHELEYQAIAATAIEAVEGPKATERQKTGMKIVRDLVLGSIAERREAARNALAGLPLRQSSNVALWTRKLGQKQNEVYKLMADENWEGAKDAKAEQLMYAAMVTEVGAIKEATLKTVEEVKDNLARIQKGTHRMPIQARYWYEHIAFVLGIKKRDAVEPGEGVKPLAQAFAELLDDGGLDEKPAVDVPQWLIQLSAAQGNVGLDSLTQDEFDKATTLMDSLYKMSARRENLYVVNDGAKLKDVVDELCEHMDVVPELKKTPVDRNTIPDKVVRQVRNAAEFFGNAFGTLVTPATIMQRMDGYADALGHGKTGRATKWLYDSVQKAANKEIVLNAEFARKLDSIFSSYTSGEFSDVRNKRAYKFGERLVTKEELMVLALYCGTEKSYMRILDNEKLSDDEPSVLREVREEADIFARRDRVERELYKALAQLDRKDLETVEKIWDLMGEHFDEESDIMERTTGIPLKKDRTIKVKVTTRDGSQYELKGGYFPIVYDVEQSVAAADMETQDALNSMAPGTKRMGQGKGFTKARADRVTGRPLALTFDTISRKGGEMLHYVAFRETALDVSRIINNKKFAATVKDLMGMQAYKTLQNWAADIWAPPKPDRDPLGMMMRSMRTRTTTAILAYRVSTMLLNFTNIPVAMTYMGAGEFVHAMGDFWQAPRKNLDLVNGMSPFMAERSEHLDANIREAITTAKLEPGPAKMRDTIQKNGFKLIGATDNMFAYPLWLAAYKRVLNEKLQEGIAVEKAQEAAIAESDRAVIKVIGSGDIKDLSPAQKGGEMAKALTMFYTFQNALYNLMANKYYAAKNAALKKYGRTTKLWWLKKEAIIPMGHYFLLTIMGGAMVDTAIRTAMESVGGSDDDKEGFAKKYAQTVLEATTATVPVVRDLSRAFISMVLDPKAKYKQNVRATSAFDLLNRLVKGVSTGVDWWQGNKQRSDLLRDTGKLIGFLGMPDVLIDGASVALQYFESKESERDVGELIRAIILDRKMPKPKKEPKDPFKAQRQKMRQKIRKNQ